MRITREDLRWWLGLAPGLEWIWAKTYADSAPHHYVVLDRSPLGKADFIRAGAVIRTFGQPGKFWGHTNIYLTDGRWKWWTMDPEVEDTDLINRATVDQVYGPQDAPRTFTGRFIEYDSVATEYDRGRDCTWGEAVRRQVADHFGDHAPRTLDVGCGTGVVLDLGLTLPARYTGLDPSQAMLNELVRKHPNVRHVIAATLQEAQGLEQQCELVVALNVPEVARSRLEALNADLLVREPGN